MRWVLVRTRDRGLYNHRSRERVFNLIKNRTNRKTHYARALPVALTSLSAGHKVTSHGLDSWAGPRAAAALRRPGETRARASGSLIQVDV